MKPNIPANDPGNIAGELLAAMGLKPPAPHPEIKGEMRDDHALIGRLADHVTRTADHVAFVANCKCQRCRFFHSGNRVTLALAKLAYAAALSGDASKLDKLAAFAEELLRS